MILTSNFLGKEQELQPIKKPSDMHFYSDQIQILPAVRCVQLHRGNSGEPGSAIMYDVPLPCLMLNYFVQSCGVFSCCYCRFWSDSPWWGDPSQQLNTYTATCLLPPHRMRERKKQKWEISQMRKKFSKCGKWGEEQMSDSDNHSPPPTSRLMPPQSLSNNYLGRQTPPHCWGFCRLLVLC